VKLSKAELFKVLKPFHDDDEKLQVGEALHCCTAYDRKGLRHFAVDVRVRE
jgi:hypothetical protein